MKGWSFSSLTQCSLRRLTPMLKDGITTSNESFLYCVFGRHGPCPQEQALPSLACSFFGSDTRNSPVNNRSLGYSRTAEKTRVGSRHAGCLDVRLFFYKLTLLTMKSFNCCHAVNSISLIVLDNFLIYFCWFNLSLTSQPHRSFLFEVVLL